MGRSSQDESETHILKFVLSASGKGRIEDQKTRALVHRKDAPPKVQNRSKAGAPGTQIQNRARAGEPGKAALTVVVSF